MPEATDIAKRVRRLTQMKRNMDEKIAAARRAGGDPTDPQFAAMRAMQKNVTRRLEKLVGPSDQAPA